jgi:hypothetical protein
MERVNGMAFRSEFVLLRSNRLVKLWIFNPLRHYSLQVHACGIPG